MEEIGTSRRLSATMGEPVSTPTGWGSSTALRHSSLPVWASKARTTRSLWPTKVAQPLGEIADRTTIGVVRETRSSTVQWTQPVLASMAKKVPERLVTKSQSPTTVG